MFLLPGYKSTFKSLVYLMVAFPSPIILVKRFPTLSLIKYFTPALFDRLESIKNTCLSDNDKTRKDKRCQHKILPNLIGGDDHRDPLTKSCQHISTFSMILYRAASGVLSNIDHQKTPQISTKLFEISTTQHYIDQISTAKVP